MYSMSLSAYEILALAGALIIIPLVIYLATNKRPAESVTVAASLAAGFGAFTAVTIWAEGVLPVIINHTSNLWGVQVWFDLLISVTIALLFILPRARKVKMNVPLWALFVASTASIGLLAMVGRLFWLERAAMSQVNAADGLKKT
ncbi:MAG: hypothetical protein WAT93_01255 [Pontixanthobacter sp.]